MQPLLHKINKMDHEETEEERFYRDHIHERPESIGTPRNGDVDYFPLDPVFTTEKDGDFLKWQIVEAVESSIMKPYKFRVVPESFSKHEEPNNKNYLASSWMFHQLFHGIDVTPAGVPLFFMNFDRDAETTVEAVDGVRHKIFVRLQFQDKGGIERVLKMLKEGSVLKDDGTIESFLHVLDVEEFRLSLDVRKALTESAWRKSSAKMKKVN